jgi:hypothetical protein
VLDAMDYGAAVRSSREAAFEGKRSSLPSADLRFVNGYGTSIGTIDRQVAWPLAPSTVSREMSRNGGYLTGPDLKHGDDPCSKPLAKLSRREPPSLTLPAGIELTPVSCGYVGADDILVSLKTKTGDVVSHTLKTAAMVHMVNLSVALINGFTAQVLRDLGAL